jgi:CheY-like chemotaxis protein
MRRIVVVEDNPADLVLIREALERAGLADYCCDVAEDGEEAIRMLQKRTLERQPTDLVVLDLNLPRTPGIEVVKAIRRDPALASTRVVAWSSSILHRDAMQLTELGVECIVKPSHLQEYDEIGRRFQQLIQGERHRVQGAE